MASLNPLTREVVFKIVFYGPGLGGKTTTLQHIHAASKPENRGKMVSLATPMDRTLYFDFLPLRMPLVHGMHVRLQLFTVPGQVYFGATRKLVLTGADGVVFVADSQVGRQDANHEALEDLVMNLAENNLALLNLPHTFHWNKRDIPDVVSLAELDRTLNRQGAPSLGTIATTGEGVFAGLETITKLVFQAYESELPKSESAPLERAPAERAAIEETTIADALRGLAEAPLRSRAVAPESGPGRSSTATNRGGAGAPPSVSSLESIPNPIPRRPTGSFDGTGASTTAPTSTANPASTPGSKPATPAPRTSTPQPSSHVNGGAAPPARSANPGSTRSLPAVVGSVPASSPVAPSAPGAAPNQLETSDDPRERLRSQEDLASPPAPATQHTPSHPFTLRSLWPEHDREAASRAEHALASFDGSTAVLACDGLVTRALLEANPSAPRDGAAPDAALTVLLLGLDGRRYLALQGAVRAARAEGAVPAVVALDAYLFALEVRRAVSTRRA